MRKLFFYLLLLFVFAGCKEKKQVPSPAERPVKTEKPAVFPLDKIDFKVTSERWEKALSATEASYIHIKRIDFKIKNNADEDIKSLKVKVVFILEEEGEKELWDENEKTVISPFDTPLSPGFVKRDWIQSTKGYVFYPYWISDENFGYTIYLNINNTGWQKVYEKKIKKSTGQ